MTNNLSKIRIGGAPQGVGEDKVHQDAFGIGNRIGLKTFGIMDSFGKVDVRYRMCGECGCKLQRGCRKIRADVFIVGTMGKGGTETGGKFMREKRIGLAKEADVFV